MEYAFWSLLGAPGADLEIEWLVGGPASDRYVDPSFSPSAVICEKGPTSRERIRGLPEVNRYGSFRLFLDLSPG